MKQSHERQSMSFLRWFSSGKKRKHEAQPSVMPSSGLSRLESTKPFHAAGMHGSAQPANRKQERMLRREQLYGVVREAMVRASVLSSSYKFKVLSLDPLGRTFMVMVDLAQGSASDTTRLAELEAMIAQSAKARHDIHVTAVYWRANEHVAVGDPLQSPSHRMPLVSQPAALHPEPRLHRAGREAPASRPRPTQARAAEARVPAGDPLHPTEVAAFRKALDAGLRGEQALASANGSKPAQNYTLLTGFEDTEMANDGAAGELSGTQYGALR
jgi:hypothetical protein